MMQHWLARAMGEVKITVRGSSLPRFLNVCTLHRIHLSRLKRVDLCTLTAYLSIRDFKRLRLYMGRTGCRVHIIKRRGLPFFLRKMRGRVLLWLGLIALFVLFYVFHQFLWVIDLHIQPGIPADRLRVQLEELGVHAGARVRDLDEDAIRLQLLQEFDEISTLAIAQFGNSIRIEAYYREPTPLTVDYDAITGLVATQDGVISRLEVTGGHALYRVGDAVAQGELLVSPCMPSTREDLPPYYTHSMGRVWATTWQEQTYVRPQTHQEKVYTDKTTTQYALVFGEKRINLYFGCGIVGGTCDKIVERERLSIGSKLQLPFCLVTQTYRYYDAVTVQDDPAQWEEQLSQNAIARMTADLDGTVLSETHALTAENDGLYLVQKLTCDAQIAQEVAIPEEQLPPIETVE